MRVTEIFVVAEVTAVARVVRRQLGFGRNLKRRREVYPCYYIGW